MSPARRLLRLFSAVALAAALWLLWSHLHPPAPMSAPPVTITAAQPAAPALPPAATPTGGATVQFDVVDPSGAPISGMAITLNGAEGTTDAQGTLTLQGVQPGVAVTTVSAPWLIRAGSTSRAVHPPAQRRLLIVERACPGALHLTEEDSLPIEGVRVFQWQTAQLAAASSAVPLISDSTGAVFLPQRPCGAVNVSVRLPGGEVLPALSVFVEGDQPATLIIPRPRDGTLLVLDEYGDPLPATARPPPAATAEPDGTGRFTLRARRALLPVTVSAPGYPEQQVRVPLTGDVFVYTIDTPRDVDVTVQCAPDDCPAQLACAQAACTALGAARHRCPCPDEAASLAIRAGEHTFTEIGTVFPDEDAVEIDLRASVVLAGQWIGDLPCEVSVRYERSTSHMASRSCDEEGHFSFVGLRPGWVTVHIQGRGEQAAHSLELLSGDVLDMGELWPESMSASGYIDADFPLQGARLESFPHGAVSLDPAGTFTLAGLPRQARAVSLHLVSPIYGTFRGEFALAAGEEIVWRLSWQPAESDAGDTADPMGDSGDPGDDSGLMLDDTGWSEVGDSGWDSGW